MSAKPFERVRHLKRGTEYEVLGEAEAQVSEGMKRYGMPGATRLISDEGRLTVYRCIKTGKLWARFTDEFRDGRFETIAASPPAPVTGTEGTGFRYSVVLKWSEEDQAFVGRVPELLGCCFHGDTQVEAIGEAASAIACWIEAAEAAGNPIPAAALLNDADLPTWISAPSSQPSDGCGDVELERLSKAATQELLSVSSVRRRYDEPSCVVVNTPSCAGLFALATGFRGENSLQSLADAKFLVGLWNAYRSGLLVPASLAPDLGGGEKQGEPFGTGYSSETTPSGRGASREYPSRERVEAARDIIADGQHCDGGCELAENGPCPCRDIAKEVLAADAEYRAYEQIEATSALVQQGWDADEAVFDKARIDFLQAAARKSQTGISFDYVPSVEGEPSGWRFMRRFWIGEQKKSLREAIDAARKDMEVPR